MRFWERKRERNIRSCRLRSWRLHVSIIRLPLQVWDYLNNPAAPMLRNLKNFKEETRNFVGSLSKD